MNEVAFRALRVGIDDGCGEVELGENNTVLVLAETYLTTEIAPIEPERRDRLVPEMHPAHARTATGDFHRCQVTGQQDLFDRLALVGQPVEQDVVTGK